MFSKFDDHIQSDELSAADLYEAQAEWEAEQEAQGQRQQPVTLTLALTFTWTMRLVGSPDSKYSRARFKGRGSVCLKVDGDVSPYNYIPM